MVVWKIFHTFALTLTIEPTRLWISPRAAGQPRLSQGDGGA